MLTHRQTDRQTDKQTKSGKNITSLGEVKISGLLFKTRCISSNYVSSRLSEKVIDHASGMGIFAVFG